MRALSLWQPWATLYVEGVKEYETRPRRMNHRGPLAIHAARFSDRQLRAVIGRDGYARLESLLRYSNLPPVAELARGALVGKVDVLDCYAIDEDVPGRPFLRTPRGPRIVSQVEYWLGDFRRGRFAIQAAPGSQVALEEPVVWRGCQGLFTVPDDALRVA